MTKFFAETKGGKWSVTVEPHQDNSACLIWVERKNGHPCGSGGSSNHVYVTRRIAMMIQDSKIIDSINYIIKHDEIGVGEELKLIDSTKCYPVYRVRESQITKN